MAMAEQQQPPLSPRARGLEHRLSFTERVGSLLHPHQSTGGLSLRRGSVGTTTGGGALDPAAALAAFRAAVEDAGLHLQMSPEMIYAGDYLATLRRFLDARKGNLDAALKMLGDSIAWRHLSGADMALSRPLDPSIRALAREARPSSYIGFDDLNRPIFYERVGHINHHVLERSGLTDEQMLQYHCVEMEYMGQRVFAEATERNGGRTVDKLVSIIDTQGLRLSSLTGFVQRLFRAMLSIDSDNYPESCAHIFIVNNSAAFTMLWGVVAPWVDAGTRSKVHVLGSGRAMHTELLKHFRPEQLPSLLAGCGTLDYESVRCEWADKIDAAMDRAAREYARSHAGSAAPEAPASPRLALHERRVLSRRTSSMRHGHLVGGPASAAAVVLAADAELASGAHVGSAEARRRSSIGHSSGGGGGGGGAAVAAVAAAAAGGAGAWVGAAAAKSPPPPPPSQQQQLLPPPFSLAVATAPPGGAGGYHDDDDDDAAWATPRSAMSRASTASGVSVYYDAATDDEGRVQQRQQGTGGRVGQPRRGGGLCGGGGGVDEDGAPPGCGCVVS